MAVPERFLQMRIDGSGRRQWQEFWKSGLTHKIVLFEVSKFLPWLPAWYPRKTAVSSLTAAP